ncbi:MAG: Smr/MutS family protein [Parvularcula sp.]
MSRRKPKRPLTDDEAELWQKVARSVNPLDPDGIVLPQPAPSPPSPARAAQRFRQSAPARKPSFSAPAIERLHAGDPKKARRVARGRSQINATIDLHGMRQLEAEMRLHRFLSGAKTSGHRTVLVITGKGAPDGVYDPFAESPRGILRRRFLEWIDRPPFSSLISSVAPAHIKHGGSGAFYVFLTRP